MAINLNNITLHHPLSLTSISDLTSYLILRKSALELIGAENEHLNLRKSVIEHRLSVLNSFKSHCFPAVEAHIYNGKSLREEIIAQVDFSTTKNRSEIEWGRLYPTIRGSSYQ